MKIFDMKDYIPSPEEMQNRELAYNLADDSLSLKVDSGLVKRILTNLLKKTGGIIDGDLLVNGIINATKVMQGDNSILYAVTNSHGTALQFYDGSVIMFGKIYPGTYLKKETNVHGTTAGETHVSKGTYTYPITLTRVDGIFTSSLDFNTTSSYTGTPTLTDVEVFERYAGPDKGYISILIFGRYK